MSEGRTERVSRMETRLNDCLRGVEAFGRNLDAFAALQKEIAELSAYYGSADWHADREADERGELPAELRRGVLSEDACYEALTENRAMAIRMLETAAAMLK